MNLDDYTPEQPWPYRFIPPVTDELEALCLKLGYFSDGVTWCPDWIYNVQVGESVGEPKLWLPANLHDLRYWMARNEMLLRSALPVGNDLEGFNFSSQDARAEADVEFLRGLRRALHGRTWFGLGWLASMRCWTYYVGVRRFGGQFWEWDLGA